MCHPIGDTGRPSRPFRIGARIRKGDAHRAASTVRGGNLDHAAECVHAFLRRRQADVTVEQRLPQSPGRNPAAVVAHCQDHSPSMPRDHASDASGPSVLGGIPEQLASEREEHLSVCRGNFRVYLYLDRGCGFGSMATCHLFERGAQAGVVEHVRVQIEDLLT